MCIFGLKYPDLTLVRPLVLTGKPYEDVEKRKNGEVS